VEVDAVGELVVDDSVLLVGEVVLVEEVGLVVEVVGELVDVLVEVGLVVVVGELVELVPLSVEVVELVVEDRVEVAPESVVAPAAPAKLSKTRAAKTATLQTAAAIAPLKYIAYQPTSQRPCRTYPDPPCVSRGTPAFRFR
jgi:hypothetical protein